MHLRYAEAANSLLDEILAAPPYDTVLVEVETFQGRKARPRKSAR